MQQIADKVGVHVTTVSRAVDDKWIQTPRGIFPLKRFFCGGTVSADGEEVAWDAVRLKLQEIIDNEDKQHPLSRRRTGQGAGQARPDRRPPHGDQVSQGDEHPQLAPAPRLERRPARDRHAAAGASQWQVARRRARGGRRAGAARRRRVTPVRITLASSGATGILPVLRLVQDSRRPWYINWRDASATRQRGRQSAFCALTPIPRLRRGAAALHAGPCRSCGRLAARRPPLQSITPGRCGRWS